MLLRLAIISLFMSPLLATADSGESKSLVFQGQRQERLDLRGELSHTEYRTEVYEGTCYNRELSHYRTECRTESRRVCDFFEQLVPGPSNPKPGGPGGDPDRPDPYEPRPDPGPSCRTVYERVCHEEPVYVDVPYSCTKTRQIPYTVKDGDALNHVLINFGEIPAGIALSDTVTVKSSGINISVDIQNNSGQVLYKITQQQSKSGSGNLVETTTVVNVTILPVAAINSAVSNGMTDLTLTSSGISFVIGKVHVAEYLVAHLLIKKSVFLGSKTLFDSDLQPSQMILTDMGDKTKVEIKAETLGLDLVNKTLKITAKVRLNVPANIAKPGSISNLQPEQSIKQKIKQ